jgi:hypothetical protein
VGARTGVVRFSLCWRGRAFLNYLYEISRNKLVLIMMSITYKYLGNLLRMIPVFIVIVTSSETMLHGRLQSLVPEKKGV